MPLISVPGATQTSCDGYAALLADGVERIDDALKGVYQLSLGGTAVGTGINATEGFAEAAEIARMTGLHFVSAPNKFAVQGSHDGVLVAAGYSGAGAGKNNPADQAIPDVGPIPQGAWLIVGPPANTEEHGPYVLTLEPEAGTETHGRSEFLLHGDSIQHPGEASKGCVILPRRTRESVWLSGDRKLQVIN